LEFLRLLECLKEYVEINDGKWESTIIKGAKGFRFQIFGRLWEVDEALNEMLGLSKDETEVVPEDGGDFSNIGRSASFDLVLVEGEEHLKEILEASLEEWRIFLHPYQKKLVQ